MLTLSFMETIAPCFTIGSTVRCITCFDEPIVGQVESFDHRSKMLILKCECSAAPAADSDQRELCDMNIINLSLCKSIEVLKESEPKEATPEPPINIAHVHQRFQQTVKERSIFLSNQNAKATQQAQEIFQLLAKQFGNKEVIWKGATIELLGQLIITPPYNKANITAPAKCQKLLQYVQRLVANYYKMAKADDNAKILPAAK